MSSNREVTEAHFLHERTGLEAVLRPPVKLPTALAWIPARETLLAATKEGLLQSVDPVLGTRVLMEGIGETAAIAVKDDRSRLLLMNREGDWRVASLTGELLQQGRHQFIGGMDGFFADPFVLLVGDEAEGRVVLLLQDGQVKHRMPVPTRVAVALDEQGKGLLARSVESGLTVIKFGKEKFQKDESTQHRLRAATRHFLGFTPTGIALWEQTGGQPITMRLPDLTAGDVSRDGKYLGLGTRSGAVALARVDKIEKRIRPDLVRAFNAPVTCVSFSSRGKWLATGAEGLRIWSWEEKD